jgi:hypothetical protein
MNLESDVTATLRKNNPYDMEKQKKQSHNIEEWDNRSE